MLERIAGNSALKQHFSTALASGHVPHSILLVGEAGCGAGFAARCLAADWLYPQGGPHAEAVLRGQDSECVTVRGEGASGQIPVDRIRAVREEMQHSALSQATGRVLFLYGAQNLNASSGNALLKILEEPPPDVLFLLTAVSAATVLPTVRSRCAIYTVSPVPQQECSEAVLQLSPAPVPKPTKAQALDLAFLYDGHLGTCRAALFEPEAKRALATARELCEAVAAADGYTVSARLAKLEKDRPGAVRVLRQLAYLASGALRKPGYAGLDAVQAAAVIRAADRAQTALSGSGNLRLTLAVFAGEISEKEL